MKRVITLLWVVMALSILGSCAPTKQITEAPTTSSATAQVFTPSVTSSFQVTLTPNLYSTSTPTAIPILSTEEAYSQLLELIRTNGNCRLPCWWGIVPGQTTTLDAYNRLVPLRGIAGNNFLSTTDKGSIDFDIVRNELLIDVYMNYLIFPRRQTIDMIYVSTQAIRRFGDSYEGVFGAASYDELLGLYSIHRMLFNYGKPAQVYLSVDISYAEPNAADRFEIRLLYPEQGVFLGYRGPAEIVDDRVRICPSKTFVRLWLISRDKGNSYEEILPSLTSDWQEYFPRPSIYSRIRLLDEAVQMSDYEFYQMFKEKTDKCLETPLDIWPLG